MGISILRVFPLLILIGGIFSLGGEASAQTSTKRPPVCKNQNGLTRNELLQILNTHNFIRAGLKLPQLSWDCDLADYAQEWAKRGLAEHREYTEFGESIFVDTTRDVEAVAGVNRWMLEKPHWNNRAGKCASGKVCTHYTQIVWKKTARIGCGINRDLTGKWKTLLICNYDPAGNAPGPAF